MEIITIEAMVAHAWLLLLDVRDALLQTSLYERLHLGMLALTVLVVVAHRPRVSKRDVVDALRSLIQEEVAKARSYTP